VAAGPFAFIAVPALVFRTLRRDHRGLFVGQGHRGEVGGGVVPAIVIVAERVIDLGCVTRFIGALVVVGVLDVGVLNVVVILGTGDAVSTHAWTRLTLLDLSSDRVGLHPFDPGARV
jgi:hypothetical protein